MNHYWELVKDRGEVQKYVEYCDASGASVLDYCKIRKRHDIYSTIGCFCSDKAKIVTLEYKEILEKEEWKIKQNKKIEELIKINEKLASHLRATSAFNVEGFQYRRLELGLKVSNEADSPNNFSNLLKAIPRHDQTECVWIDSEPALAEMSNAILKNYRAIGVDAEYHDLEKVLINTPLLSHRTSQSSASCKYQRWIVTTLSTPLLFARSFLNILDRYLSQLKLYFLGILTVTLGQGDAWLRHRYSSLDSNFGYN